MESLIRNLVRRTLKENYVDEEIDIKADPQREWIYLTSDVPGELFSGFAKEGPLQQLAKEYGLKFFFNAPTKRWFMSYKPETLEKSQKYTGVGTKEELRDKVLDFIQAANKKLDAGYQEKSPEELKEKYKYFFKTIEKIDSDVDKINTDDIQADEEEMTVTKDLKAALQKDSKDYTKYIEELAESMDEDKLVQEIIKIENMRKKMHGFSWSNTILIMLQSNGTATNCMNKRDWQKYFNRRIKNINQGFLVSFPVFQDSKANPLAIRKMVAKAREEGKTKRAEELEKRAKEGKPVLTGFAWGITYDVSNTEVIPGKEDKLYKYKWHEDDKPDELADKLFNFATELAKKIGIQIDIKDAMSARGASSGGKIFLQSKIQGVGALSTILHEIAHELMHWKDSKFYSEDGAKRTPDGYDIGELQAEAVAFIILRHFGFQLSGTHQLYIKLYRGDKEKIKKYTDLLAKVAQYIENGINEIARESGEI